MSGATTTGRHRGPSLGKEASGFAAVGVVALAVDVGSYNALVHLTGDSLLGDQPLVAKTVSVTASTTVAYFGNRFWTYRHRPRGRFTREYVLFFVLSAIALGIALGCLAFSRYVLGLTSPLADNVSANGIGLALGSLFRFGTYRRYVFRHPPLTPAAEDGTATDGQEVEGDAWARRRGRAGTSVPQPVPASTASSTASSTGAGDRRN